MLSADQFWSAEGTVHRAAQIDPLHSPVLGGGLVEAEQAARRAFSSNHPDHSFLKERCRVNR
jgi:hypothetical protein